MLSQPLTSPFQRPPYARIRSEQLIYTSCVLHGQFLPEHLSVTFLQTVFKSCLVLLRS